jgi:serine/threonine-protein kinase
VVELVSLIGDIAGALGYCHQNGVVHADVNPRQIACGRDGAVLDGFGRAASFRLFGYLAEGMALGNPTYFSPELCAGEPLDGRSDIYSLGIIAYQCLTGAPPFLDARDLVRVRLEEDPPTPIFTSMREKRLYGIVRKMLARDRETRYESAEACLSALEDLPE